MHHFRYCRYLARFLSILLAIGYLTSATHCYAKDKRHHGKKSKASAVQTKKKSSKTKNLKTSTPEPNLAGIPFEETVSEYLGTPYQRGGTDTNGIDCSGLSRRFYLEVFGLSLPHNSAEQSRLKIFEKIPLDSRAFESSDLLFFRNKNKQINHVGIYLENGNFLHAIPKRGVIISNLDQSYWKQRLVASRRVKDTVKAKATAAGAFTETLDAGEISMGYSADLDKNLNFNFGTFYSGTFPRTDTTPSYSSGILSNGSPELEATSLGNWQGMRASANIHPVSWLQIRPSLGMIDGPSGWSDIDSSTWRVYGLEAAIAPVLSQWSLVLSFHSLFNETYFSTYEDAADTDIGLHFNYSLSKTMRLSIMGTWEGSYLFRDAKETDTTRDRDVRNLSFNLEFSF